MICPHCNYEITDGLNECPNCGQPLLEGADVELVDDNDDDDTDDGDGGDDNPRLSLFTKIFIVVGIVALAACSYIYYDMHKNDPEYLRTQIEPDSAIADHFEVMFDTLSVDTAKAKLEEKQEKDKADNVFNSIRRTTPKAEEPVAAEPTEPTEGESAEPSEPAAPAEPAAPVEAPKVEVLE